MFTLTHLVTSPPEALKSQLLQMVVDYFSDISAVSLQPDNPLYPLYQYVVGLEVHRYLERMEGAQPGQPERSWRWMPTTRPSCSASHSTCPRWMTPRRAR